MNEEEYIVDQPPVPPPAKRPAKKAPDAGAADAGADRRAVPAKKGSKKAAGNPRDGRVKKGEGGEAASFEPGDASPPKDGGKLDPQEICEALHLWWEIDGGDQFVLKTDGGRWARWPMGAIKLRARKLLKEKMGRFIALAARKESDEIISEMDEVLLWAREHRCVDEVVPALAGFRNGTVDLRDGRKIVVRMSPRLIDPVEGEWPTIKVLIEDRLNLGEGDVNQSVYFHAWMRNAYRSLMYGKPGSYKPGHALVMAGPVGSGKSRLQEMIITPLLGGRSGDPTAFLKGDDSFNVDLIGSEHLMMEELLTSSWSAADRVNLSEAMKRMVANSNHRLRLMRTDPITVQPFWRLTLSMNNDPDKLRAFPMLTPDFRDKVLMLLVCKRPMPMPTATDEEQAAFNAAVAKELPAYAHWLLHGFELPEEMLKDDEGNDATRFGFASFQHAQLSEALFDDTPAATLLRLIDQAEIEPRSGVPQKLWELSHPHNWSGGKPRGAAWKNQADVWHGSAELLEDLLCGHKEGWTSNVGRAASRLMGKGSLVSMLQRLQEDRPDRVGKKDRAEFRGWMISAPVGQRGAELTPKGDGGEDAWDELTRGE